MSSSLKSSSSWQAWEHATAEYIGCRVVGFVPGYGVFDIRRGVICRVFEGSRYRLGSFRAATHDEVATLDWAAAHGALQIEVRPVTGVFRGQNSSGVASEEMKTIVVWQARGT